MAVVEQKRVASAADAMPSDRRDQIMRVPLLHDRHVGAVHGLIEVDMVYIIGVHRSPGHERGGFRESCCAAVLHGIHPAPAVLRLIDDDLDAEPKQFARYAAQEMRVSIVPA